MDWPDDPRASGSAAFRGLRASRPVEHVDAVAEGHRLVEGGFWVLVATFEGRMDAWRFADVKRVEPVKEPSHVTREWRGPGAGEWSSSLDRDRYMAGVKAIRADIREGDVYQANLCRVLSAPLASAPPGPDAVALSDVL